MAGLEAIALALGKDKDLLSLDLGNNEIDARESLYLLHANTISRRSIMVLDFPSHCLFLLAHPVQRQSDH